MVHFIRKAQAKNSRLKLVGLPYRPGVGIMLLNPDNQVFVARRRDMQSEAWQMPQGGIKEGESPSEALFRELQEETGTDKAEILLESKVWRHYDLPARLVPRLWGGRFRGQRQKWFALRFLGEDGDINIHGENPEFIEWRWENLDALPSLIVPFKLALYREVIQEFRPKLDL